MVSLATAYWAGLAAADSARDHRRMWNIATRATQRQQVPVDDRAALIDQVVQLQAQALQAGAVIKHLTAERDAILNKYCNEHLAHQETQIELGAARLRLFRLREHEGDDPF